MDLRKLKTLIDLVQNSGISELEISEGEEKIRIAKQGPVATPGNTTYMVAPAAPAMASALPQAGSASAAAEPALEEEGQVLKAPMVGTFYRAGSPEGPPFVELGKAVKQGDTLCIIEAMKLMNEIEAEASGTIKAILIENGQPVEYGQPMFIIG